MTVEKTPDPSPAPAPDPSGYGRSELAYSTSTPSTEVVDPGFDPDVLARLEKTLADTAPPVSAPRSRRPRPNAPTANGTGGPASPAPRAPRAPTAPRGPRTAYFDTLNDYVPPKPKPVEEKTEGQKVTEFLSGWAGRKAARLGALGLKSYDDLHYNDGLHSPVNYDLGPRFVTRLVDKNGAPLNYPGKNKAEQAPEKPESKFSARMRRLGEAASANRRLIRDIGLGNFIKESVAQGGSASERYNRIILKTGNKLNAGMKILLKHRAEAQPRKEARKTAAEAAKAERVATRLKNKEDKQAKAEKVAKPERSESLIKKFRHIGEAAILNLQTVRGLDAKTNLKNLDEYLYAKLQGAKTLPGKAAEGYFTARGVVYEVLTPARKKIIFAHREALARKAERIRRNESRNRIPTSEA